MKEYFLNVFSYEHWANEYIINFIIQMQNPPEKILSIMSHIINAQILWLSRLKNTSSEVEVWQMNKKDELVEVFSRTKLDFDFYLENLLDSHFSKAIVYVNSRGEKFESNVRDILTHLTYHSAYHRGQIIILMKDHISTLPYTDYIHYVRSIKT